MTPTVYKYVNDLPYKPRLELCNILDYNYDWKTLGGTYLKYNNYDLFQMENAILRRGSPTDEMLARAGAANLTVLELFNYLRCMKHYRAMLVLKPHIDKKYHTWIPEGCCENRTAEPPPRERCVFTQENMKTAQPNVKANAPEASVKQETTPRNQNNEPTRKVSDPVTPLNVVGGTPHISYQELTVATNNWDKLNILGKGGFGTVYKGFWKNTPIAVKKLEVMRSDKSEETLNQCQREQSLRELKYLNSCRHDNILPLYGISFETGKYCLVYQFMPNGSLEDRLLMRRNTPTLMWSERLNIAKGTALGLQFLHSREPPLIHGDIKSANILLNAHLDPVLGDFGLTQEGPIEKATHITLKRVNGTRPYLPYEFLSAKRLSTKVDVYGFGIVQFELATGMRAYNDTRRSERLLKNLVDNYAEENMYELVDKNAQPLDLNIANAFFKIGKVSTKLLAKERPEMIQVFNMLCGSGENSNATGPSVRPTLPLSSATPVRSIQANPVTNPPPRYKFVKTQETTAPYLPAPIQIMNAPHLLQQNSSLFPHPHMRPQQTGSQNMLAQSQQGHIVRSGHPNELPPRPVPTSHAIQSPGNIVNINLSPSLIPNINALPSHIINTNTSRSSIPNGLVSPNINTFSTCVPNINAIPSFISSSRPVANINESPDINLPSSTPGPAINTMPPISKIDKTIPEASHSQEECSSECSGNHSSSDSDGSVEILDRKSIQKVEKSIPSAQKLPLFLDESQKRVSPSPTVTQDNNSIKLPSQDTQSPMVVQDYNRSGVDIVPASSIPLLQLFNINR